MKKWTYQDNRLVNKINWKNNKKKFRKEKQKIEQRLLQQIEDRWQEYYIVNEDDIVDCDN